MAEFCTTCARKMGFEPEPLEPGEICEGCGKTGPEKTRRFEASPLIYLLIIWLVMLFEANCKAQGFSKQDSTLYGTPEEKREQESLAVTPYHNHLVRFIGYKSYYMNELSKFYQELNYSVATKMNKNDFTMTFSSAGFTPAAIKKVNAAFSVDNKTERIKALTITGDTYQLIKLFVVYWPTEADFDTAEKMKNKTIAIKHLIGEEITYKFLPTGKAVISVTKPTAVN